MKVLVTGGAGFIGSALVRFLIGAAEVEVVNVDALTYAAPPGALDAVSGNPRYAFEHADIRDGQRMAQVFARHRPDIVMHLAAESHVDRSIDSPAEFVSTNVVGTCTLLDAARSYWSDMPQTRRDGFRFLHVSTDEVFGSLGAEGLFREDNRYAPNSPYAASKASSDHFARAWHHTYGLPVVVSNCSNNYGAWQFPEKLIPLITINALLGEPLPVYGKGENVRDWLFVDDHARALWAVATRGSIGETYNIGGNAERSNIAVVETICDLVDAQAPPLPNGAPRRSLIAFVADRPGHDLRYAIDAGKIRRELGWTPQETFETGLARTVGWYLANEGWWRNVRQTAYDGGRLGLSRSAAQQTARANG